MNEALVQMFRETENAIADSADRSQPIYQPVEGWEIAYPEFEAITDAQMHTFWPWDEHNVNKDSDDLRTNASEAERLGITEALMLFTMYELHAGKDYWMGRIARRFPRPEHQRMASMYAAVEYNSHAPFYNQANVVLDLTDLEFRSKWRLDPVLVERMAFIEQIVSSKDDLISIAGFTFVEGAILYSNFAYFKHYQAQECGKDLIKNFCRGINLSVGDENTHAISGALLFRRVLMERNLTKAQMTKLARLIYAIAQQAYEHEVAIAKKLLSFGDIGGITVQNMIDFIKHRIDLCLNNLGLKGLFEEDTVDGFIESWFYTNINALQFHDFFTGGGSEYDSNWNRDAFGEVYDPESPNYYEVPKRTTQAKFKLSEVEKYVVYSRTNCQYCEDSEFVLKSENIPFTKVMVGQECTVGDMRAVMGKYAPNVEIKTLPQILRKMDDGSVVYIGGANELVDDIFVGREDVILVGEV